MPAKQSAEEQGPEIDSNAIVPAASKGKAKAKTKASTKAAGKKQKKEAATEKDEPTISHTMHFIDEEVHFPTKYDASCSMTLRIPELVPMQDTREEEFVGRELVRDHFAWPTEVAEAIKAAKIEQKVAGSFALL